METTNLTELNKAWLNAMQDMFRASMTAMNTMQQEMVRMAKIMQDKNVATWQQGGTLVDEWIATVQKGQDEFRKLVDENFQRAQDYLETFKKNGGQ